MSRSFVALLLVAVFAASTLALRANDQAPTDDQRALAPGPEQIAKLERALSGAVLVGHFTVTGEKEDPGKLATERYELASVKHLGDGQWLFEARIQYGEHDVKLPLTLPVLWAGDTPVITVDKAPVIGLGTFDARVMIYRDHYAGFWSGEGHGGHLFGIVERSPR